MDHSQNHLGRLAWERRLLIAVARLARLFHFDRVLGIILLVGFAHGLLYLFLIPPWQHYDEPTHFEYAWLIANRPALLLNDGYDQDMRRQVVASMVEHGIKGLKYHPNLLPANEPISIGISERRHPPAYYWFVSLPLRLFQFTDITFQLYASRFTSLALFLLTILIARGVMLELFPPSNPLVWMVPTTMVLLPGYIDLMTSVNNDVGATAVFSLFLWGGIRLVKRGFSVPVFLLTTGMAALGAWTKSTTLVALPLLPVLVAFSLMRDSRRWMAWALLTVGVVVGCIATFSWGDAALWYRDTSQVIPTRATGVQSPLGKNAIQLEYAPTSSSAPALHQLISPGDIAALRGTSVTLGAWMWASRPIQARMPFMSVNDRDFSFSESISIGTVPAFYSFSIVLPTDAVRGHVTLQPIAQSQNHVIVFFNGILLVKGNRSGQQIPVFDDAEGRNGVWDGEPFENLLRNPSAAESGPSIQPWADAFSVRFFTGRPSVVLTSLLDWGSTGWYYWGTVQNLLRTFWGKFGWGSVPLMGARPYLVLAAFTIAGMVGAFLVIVRGESLLTWDVILVLGLALCGVWIPAAIRGAQESFFIHPFIPGARYIYPSIIATLLVFDLGWLKLGQMVSKPVHASSKLQSATYILLFLSLDVIALLTLADYYYVSG